MNDRLADLTYGGANTSMDDVTVDQMEAGTTDNGAASNYMEQFFADVETIKADIQAVRDATKAIGQINEEAVLATTTDKERELSNRLRPLVDSTNKKAKHAKALLELIKKQNQEETGKENIKSSDMRYVTTSYIVVWVYISFTMRL